MFITKEEIRHELIEEECWKDLSPKEKKMFLTYCTNGQDELRAYMDVYADPDPERVIKTPGKKAQAILAKESFQECVAIYAEILREAVSTKANAWMFTRYFEIASANILDFVDEIGQFKFSSIEEAKEQLGAKALAIAKLDLTMHPKDADKTITVPVLYDRYKAMKELAKFTKYYGSEEAGGVGLGDITIHSQLATVTKETDEFNRKRLGIE